MTVISALIKGAPERSLTISTIFGYSEKKAVYKAGRGPRPTQNLTAGTLIQPPEL